MAWTVYIFSRSPGTPVQDEVGHYLIARHAWEFPDLILHLWGRTVNTLAYMLPALGDLQAARLASILLSGLTVWITTLAARRLGVRRLFWVPLLLCFQPWFSDLSYTAITEVPFSLCLVLGVYFWLSERSSLAGLAFGLLPLIRHEGIALLGLWGAYALLTRRWKALAISAAPYALYNLAYYAVFQQLAAAVYFATTPTDIYGKGSWLHFARPLLDKAGLPVMLLAALGLVPVIRLRKKAAAFLVYLAYLLIHTIIYRYGLYASGGYDLFLFPLAPGIALAAALGAEWGLDLILALSSTGSAARFPGNSRLFARIASLAEKGLTVLLPALVILAVVLTGLTTAPRPVDAEQEACQQAAAWLRAQGFDPRAVVSTHVWFYYYYDLPWTRGGIWSKPPPLQSLGGGTIVVWDRHYSDRGKLFLSALSDPAGGWKRLADFKDGLVIVFQKQPG